MQSVQRCREEIISLLSKDVACSDLFVVITESQYLNTPLRLRDYLTNVFKPIE